MLASRAVMSCALLDAVLALRRSSRRVGEDDLVLAPSTLPVVSYIYVAAPNPADRSDNSLVKTIIEDGPDTSCNVQGFHGSPDTYTSVSPACCDKSKWDQAGHAGTSSPGGGQS